MAPKSSMKSRPSPLPSKWHGAQKGGFYAKKSCFIAIIMSVYTTTVSTECLAMAVFVLGIAEHTIEKGEPKLPLVVNGVLTTP